MRTGEKALLFGNVSLFVFAAVSFLLMPDTIVHHWGFDGPDRIGNRIKIFVAPLISTAIFVITSAASAWYQDRDPIDGDTFRYVMIVMNMMIQCVCAAGILVVLVYNL